MANSAKYNWYWALAILSLLLACVASLLYGSVSLNAVEVFNALSTTKSDSPGHAIVWYSRMPRTAVAVAAGAGLAFSGLFMQTLFRNPLAGPSVLGISSGASLGVAVVLLATGVVTSVSGWWGASSLVMAGMLGSVAVLLLILGVASKVREPVTVLLVGLMLGFFVSSCVTVLEFFSQEDALRNYVLWGMGSFSGITGSSLLILSLAIAAAVLLSISQLKPLNAYLLGEDYAQSMGINIKRTRLWVILCAGLATGAISAFCGPIAFVGIAVPHLCRGIFNTQNHLTLFPACLIVGGLIGVIADLISRLPGADWVLPLNAVTSLLGAPVIIFLLIRKRSGF